MSQKKKEYQAPQIELFEAKIERGFVGSNGPESPNMLSGLLNSEQMQEGETLHFH